MDNNRRWPGAGVNVREEGRAVDEAGVGGKGRELYLNNNKIRGKKRKKTFETTGNSS